MRILGYRILILEDDCHIHYHNGDDSIYTIKEAEKLLPEIKKEFKEWRGDVQFSVVFYPVTKDDVL